jgi:hypothetical protein
VGSHRGRRNRDDERIRREDDERSRDDERIRREDDERSRDDERIRSEDGRSIFDTAISAVGRLELLLALIVESE